MNESSLLSWIVFTPTIGAVICLFLNKDLVKRVAVLASLATFILSLWLFGTFFGGGDPDQATTIWGAGYGQAIHHVVKIPWISTETFKIEYFLGIDGLGFPLVILTTLVSFLACVASWNIEKWPISKSIKAYFVLFLLLETGMLGVFVSLDFFLFYVFWEVMLLPMYFLIGVWGGPRKEYAAIKFFLFTLAGSVLMLVALLGMFFYSGYAVAAYPELATSHVFTDPATGQPQVLTQGTFNLIELATNDAVQTYFGAASTIFLKEGWQFGIFMFLFLGIAFAVKVPTVPFHTWLPDAHVEAPTPISMILAGVLLKMGAYGFLRICYPIFPGAAVDWAPVVAAIGVISIIYGALCAMAQTDFKKLVAYSSISHMGYVMLGISVMTKAGFQGAMFQVIAHGISSPMCFYLVGVIYDRAHHREINRFGGLWLTMPKYGSLATVGFFASLGLPGLCGFIGEAYVLLGTFQARDKFDWAVPAAIIAAAGVILTAGYILWMIQRVYLGKEKEEYKGFPEATSREIFVLAPFAVLAILLGILPKQTLFDFMNGTLNLMLEHISHFSVMVASAGQING